LDHNAQYDTIIWLPKEEIIEKVVERYITRIREVPVELFTVGEQTIKERIV
jgi:hypothetical protein